jgi:L-alanine-DL-glutamate epimerase-like enolase superfamily enzyme
VEAGLSREGLQHRLPAGGARNALDCALWDLEAARSATPVWKLAGLQECRPLVTTMTAGAGTPEAMAEVAQGFLGAKAIKLKLTGEPAHDCARVHAVRRACPNVWLGVDANQGYSVDALRSVIPSFISNDVRLIEQPLPRGDEALLDGFDSPIPLAADESLQTIDDFDRVVHRFAVVNIKLDKCGGLTAALAMAARARELGLGVMVGNMAGSSWAMAPAYIVGQFCNIVDLDGPLALRDDRSPAVQYVNGAIVCTDTVWGCGVVPH